MKKKAELPLYVLLSIVITIVGISLVLVLAGRNTSLGRKIYCTSFYSPESRTDPFCEEYLSMGRVGVKPETAALAAFRTNRKTEFVFLNSTNSYTTTQYIKIPRTADIRSAKLDIRLSTQSLNIFESNKTKEIIVVPLGRPQISKNTSYLPQNAKVVNARMEVSGAKFPSKANIVFVIDTSGSMNNEWTTLCGILSQINSSLKKLGINATTDIYGLSEGDTVGECMKTRISREEMTSVMNLPVVSQDLGARWSYPPYDDYWESWALGAAWVADNYRWATGTDVKRIAIPISDSDPTGGGQTQLSSSSDWEGEAVMTGTEGTAVNLLISRANAPPENHVYVIPVYGDEEGNAEGFSVGSAQCLDPGNTDPKYNNCRTIMSWMNRIAQDTGAKSAGAKIIGFSDVPNFLENLMAVIITPFPSNIELKVNNQPLWKYDGRLDSDKSPQAITTPDFADKVQGCLSVPGYCTGRGCVCPITVISDDGTVVFDKLRIDYMQDPKVQSVKIGGAGVAMASLDYANPEREADIAAGLESAMQSCSEPECIIPIEVKGAEAGTVELRVNVTYDNYDIEGRLLEEIINCWRESRKGLSSKNILCREMAVPELYTYRYPITEEAITNLLKERNYCHILPNSRIGATGTGCGEEDDIEFAQDIYNTRNILIEYSADKKRVVVS